MMRLILWATVLIVFLSGTAFYLVEHVGLRGPYERTAPNDAAAAHRIAELSEQEYQYAKSFGGFACDLESVNSKLKLNGDRMDGYVYAVRNCFKDASGRVTSYQITATPERRTVTGMYTFCTDEVGDIFYELSGSAEDCLAHRRKLP